MIKQTGFLFKEDPRDYKLGASPIIWEIKNPTADWIIGRPIDEIQYKQFTFDTMSCTSFSALNNIETYLNYQIKNNSLDEDFKKFLTDEGYLVSGGLNFSDRFTAIMSGTTKQGNYFQNVWNSIDDDGLIPDADFPFGGNSWEEYHDKSKITLAMVEKGKKFASYFFVEYEFIPSDDSSIFNGLKYSPLQVAIPIPSTHAIELINVNNFYDSYPPFVEKRDKKINYSLRFKVTIKKMNTYKYFNPTQDPLMVGINPELMKILDKIRDLSQIPIRITSGLRTPQQNKDAGGVPNSAHLRGLAVDFLCTDNFKRNKYLKGIANCGSELFVEIAKKHIHIDIDKSIHSLSQTVVSDDE